MKWAQTSLLSLEQGISLLTWRWPCDVVGSLSLHCIVIDHFQWFGTVKSLGAAIKQWSAALKWSKTTIRVGFRLLKLLKAFVPNMKWFEDWHQKQLSPVKVCLGSLCYRRCTPVQVFSVVLLGWRCWGYMKNDTDVNVSVLRGAAGWRARCQSSSVDKPPCRRLIRWKHTGFKKQFPSKYSVDLTRVSCFHPLCLYDC